MNSTDLNYFRVVVQEGSLNKASNILFISRQGLTKILHRLEDELGEKLFDVTENGIVLTKYGEYLYANSEKYIQFHQEFLRNLHEYKMNETEQLTIGMQEGFSEGFGKDFIANFIIQNRNLHIRIQSLKKESIYQAMLQSELHILIMTGPYDSLKYHSILHKQAKIFLLVSKSHPLAKKSNVSMKDISPYPLISLPHDIGQKSRINYFINNNTIKLPDFLLNAADRNLIMKLVQSGVAISFNAGWHYKEYDGITAIPISDINTEIDLNILIAANVTRSSSLNKFINYVRDYSKNNNFNI